ncbi:MAG TPA: hypothetical protein VGB24_05100 [Longimicrobium sp.]|jgi:hypothetical protein|uniref:glycine-rich domain-containing protein n=1 Tax=Longimicrobium sp. TaxID=2029185 RepID=UPI002ED96116
MKQVLTHDREALKSRIWALDLDPIVVKLTHADGGTGWTRERALQGAEEYRRFLFLTVARPETIVPTEFIDEVWHTHILDTMKYAEDCDRAFGFFLHHFPYFGIRGDDDQALLQSTFRATAGIYESEFGSTYFVGLDSAGDCSGGGGCAHTAPYAAGDCSGGGGCAHPGYIVEDVVRSNLRPSLAAA